MGDECEESKLKKNKTKDTNLHQPHPLLLVSLWEQVCR
jgi:hypothetical protein